MSSTVLLLSAVTVPQPQGTIFNSINTTDQPIFMATPLVGKDTSSVDFILNGIMFLAIVSGGARQI